MKHILIIFIFLFISLLSKANNDSTQVWAEDSTVFCVGDTIVFHAAYLGQDSIVQWQWFWGNGDSTTGDSIQPYVYDSVGVYTIMVVLSDTGGIVDTAILQNYITVKDTTIDFLVDNTFQPNFCYFFKATDTVGMFDWNVENQWISDTTWTLFYIFNNPGEQTVILRQHIAYNCVVEVEKTINVRDSVLVPNVFTPNNDGINDYFEIKTNGRDNYTLTILNRYGETIFRITSKRPYWDGRTPSGEENPNGVYYYLLENQNEPTQVKKGFVYLFR